MGAEKLVALIFEKKGRIALIKLNRPEAMNAIDPDTRVELREAWERFRRDDDLWVAILTGEGDRAFCAGADLKKTMPTGENYAITLFRDERVPITPPLDLYKPVIAAVNGYAMGGGCELALACDIRIASEKAVFGLSEVRVASIPGAGGTQRLLRMIPHAIAMKMLLTGGRIDAQEAYRVGLVSDVVPHDQLMAKAEEIAQAICENGPLAVRAVKMAAMQGANMTLDQGLMVENLLWGILRDTEDRIEGRRAFAEKRKPQYKGR